MFLVTPLREDGCGLFLRTPSIDEILDAADVASENLLAELRPRRTLPDGRALGEMFKLQAQLDDVVLVSREFGECGLHLVCEAILFFRTHLDEVHSTPFLRRVPVGRH
jgi:hypothetical protein